MEKGVWEPAVDDLRPDIRVAFERIEGSAGPTSSGPPEIFFIRVDVHSIGYERFGPSIEFTFDGNFAADLSASLVQDNFDGIGLGEVQGDAQGLWDVLVCRHLVLLGGPWRRG